LVDTEDHDVTETAQPRCSPQLYNSAQFLEKVYEASGMHKTVTSSNMLFTIEEGDGKGRILVAMKDILPGTELFVEDRPLLFVNRDYLNRFDKQGRVGVFTAAYNTYSTRLAPKFRWKFMQLFGPTEGPFADSIRVLAKEMMAWENDEKRPFNEKEVHNFVKVASIWRYNACTVNADNTMAVYETATRMSHSCLPNCALEFTGLRCVCRVIRPVEKAEELTLEYNAYHRFRATHERRHIYLEKKDFTCHCLRCDAEGDDTRQLRCLDPACPGVMCMCQPLNQEPFPAEGTGYTDATYSDPRLLPCCTCGRVASAEETQVALQQERELAAFAFQLQGDLAADFDRFSAADCEAMLGRIEDGLTQPHHALAGPVLHSRWLVARYQARLTGKWEQLWASTVGYLAWLNRLHTFPSVQLLGVLVELAAALVDSKWRPALPPAQELCRRALRLSLLLRGREDQRMELDRMLVVIETRLAGSAAATETSHLCALPAADPAYFTGCLPSPPAGATRRCAHCEDSPDRVAMALSRCARCKMTPYCGPGCQKAHWKAHKAQCTPAAPKPAVLTKRAAAEDALGAEEVAGEGAGDGRGEGPAAGVSQAQRRKQECETTTEGAGQEVGLDVGCSA
jgi:hypothetical protein